jgi:hypothetical protein
VVSASRWPAIRGSETSLPAGYLLKAAPAGSTWTGTLPLTGTPCSESFHASRDSKVARAAGDIGAPMKLPSTATPVEYSL